MNGGFFGSLILLWWIQIEKPLVLPPMRGVDFSVLAVLFVIYLIRAALASY